MDLVRQSTGTQPVEADSRHGSLTAFEQLSRALQEGPSLLANMQEGYLYCRVLFEGERPVDYVYLLVNPSWERLTGLRDPIGKRVSELVPGIRESNPELFEIYGRVARTGRPEQFETYVVPLRRWLAISAYCPEEGCFAGVFQDVTDRKRTEADLREREARYRAVVETSADGVLVLDAEGRILEANQAYLRRSGYSLDDLLSMRITDLEARETPEQTARHIELVKRTGSDLFETEHRTREGLVWSAEVTTSWSPIAGGRFFAFYRDLERRSHLEAILRVRLRIADLATRAGLDELVTATLDAAEELTASRIGFFHFVDDDQETLHLQAWSTNTVKNMCTAEGKGRMVPCSGAHSNVVRGRLKVRNQPQRADPLASGPGARSPPPPACA